MAAEDGRVPTVLGDGDYERILAFRDGLRRFLRWSEDEARRAGLTPAQHQLLLAVRGHRGEPPTVTELAEHLLLRHHSVVGLLDRAESAGLVRREVDAVDKRRVRVVLEARGEQALAQLTALHLDELHELATSLRRVVDHVGTDEGARHVSGARGPDGPEAVGGAAPGGPAR
jgi:DNA-binding MarR family transcriptional regulator